MTTVLNYGGGLDAVSDVLRRVLVDELFVDLEPDEIGREDSLRDVVGLDSLGFIELRAQCEKLFGVTIDEDDFSPANFASVATVAALVTRLAHG